jgi:hypothetical protein
MQVQQPARAGDVLAWIRAGTKFNHRNKTMKTPTELELSFTKLLVLMQIQLELMDDFKGSKLYSRDIKFYMKKLEESMEKYLQVPYKSIDEDSENEESFMALMKGVNIILGATLEDIYLASGRTE